MDTLGRYYTQDIFSNLLVSMFSYKEPKTGIDIGVGGGALIKAASQRWRDCQFSGVDVDAFAVQRLNNELPSIKAFKTNSLSLRLPQSINLEASSIDIAICNPPFLKLKGKKKYAKLLNDVGLSKCAELPLLTSDIIFLAQNLKLLKVAGQLGIILPDSLLTGHNYRNFRKALLENHRVKVVIELPAKVFSKTEAQTHIVLIEKGGKSDETIPIYKADELGSCDDVVEIHRDSLFNRMDYTFWKWKEAHNYDETQNLSNHTIDIKRGTATHKQLKESGLPYFHTSHFASYPMKVNLLPDETKANSEFRCAREGDILLARVGKRCIGKVAIIESGRINISDCVYRIRPPEGMAEYLLDSFLSDKGQRWFEAHAHGVCAKVISKRDLLQFPVPSILSVAQKIQRQPDEKAAFARSSIFQE